MLGDLRVDAVFPNEALVSQVSVETLNTGTRGAHVFRAHVVSMTQNGL